MKSQEAVIKLFNNYSSIASESKYEITFGKGLPEILASIFCVATASDHKITDDLHLKILSRKQLLQRLTIALAQV